MKSKRYIAHAVCAEMCSLRRSPPTPSMRIDERGDNCAAGAARGAQLLARDRPPLLGRAQHDVPSKLSEARRVNHSLLYLCVAWDGCAARGERGR